jgi:hypothetical protein
MHNGSLVPDSAWKEGDKIANAHGLMGMFDVMQLQDDRRSFAESDGSIHDFPLQGLHKRHATEYQQTEYQTASSVGAGSNGNDNDDVGIPMEVVDPTYDLSVVTSQGGHDEHDDDEPEEPTYDLSHPRENQYGLLPSEAEYDPEEEGNYEELCEALGVVVRAIPEFGTLKRAPPSASKLMKLGSATLDADTDAKTATSLMETPRESLETANAEPARVSKFSQQLTEAGDFDMDADMDENVYGNA